jgi:hypothetical protein
MWALIENSVVREVTDIDPKGRFPESMEWVKCDRSTQEGYLYDGKKFSKPAPSAVDVDALLRQAYAANSDHLFMKWQASGLDADKQTWLKAREEVRASVLAQLG